MSLYRYDDMYKPKSAMLPHMRKEGATAPCLVYLMVSDIIDAGEDSEKALDLLIRAFGNNKFMVTSNGSFHEYNISIWTLPTKAYFYNKYMAQAHDYEDRKVQHQHLDDGDTYVNDYSQIFIDDDLYAIYKKYDVPWQLMNSYEHHTPEQLNPNYSLVLKVSKDELPDIIEKQTIRAVKAWEASRENYNEAVEEQRKPAIMEAIDEDDSGMNKANVTLLLLGSKNSVNQNTTANQASKKLRSFYITGKNVYGVINQAGGTVTVTLPVGSTKTSLTPKILFDGKQISPATNVAQNFTSPVVYTVTAWDLTTKVYTVTVNIAT